MSRNTTDTNLSILELPSVLTAIFERAQRPLLPGSNERLGLFVRYLRRKPGRGLAVIYSVDEVRQGGHTARSNDPQKSVSLTLDEQALEGARIRFNAEQARQAEIDILPSGVLRAHELGLSVQAFPADGSLPALAASCDTTPESPLFKALEVIVQQQLQTTEWRIAQARAIPVRYKPANRCVVRYQLILEQAEEEDATVKSMTIFGKVYTDPEQARTVQTLQQQLYDEQVNTGEDRALLPRPLGMIEALGLIFNEAVQPARKEERLITGTRVFRPILVRGRGGEVSDVMVQGEELRLTAKALARLHTSNVRPPQEAPRTGAKEAKRARERAALIAGHNPEQAEEVQQLADQLARRLETLTPDTYRPAHGGFKSSQLLFHSHHVFVVDFDGFCLADPALDVGYFLAYLRPSGLWYHHPGMRDWFEEAAAMFTNTYQQAMLERGVTQESINGIMERSRLYEAALIFKIATRRVNRLNSPRPQELTAMLHEIAACLNEPGKE
jgi:hypothetical protein